jgi:hypothetical protein
MQGRCEIYGPLWSTIFCLTFRRLGFNSSILTDAYAEPAPKAAALDYPVVVASNAYDIGGPIGFFVSVGRPGRPAKTLNYRTPGFIVSDCVLYKKLRILNSQS